MFWDSGYSGLNRVKSQSIQNVTESLLPKVTSKRLQRRILLSNFGLFSCDGDKLSHRSDEDQSVVLPRLIRLITWGNQDREPENWRTLHNRSGIR